MLQILILQSCDSYWSGAQAKLKKDGACAVLFDENCCKVLLDEYLALFADFVPCAVLFLIVASLFPCLLFNGQSNYLLLVLFLHIFPSILSPQSSKDHLVVKKGEQGKLCGTGSGLNPLSSCKGSGLKDDIEVTFCC